MPPGARDPHRFSDTLDADAVDRLIARLESRGRDRVFTRLFDNYAARLDLGGGASVLDIGCGTGVIARAFARRGGAARVLGIDRSPAFIAAARRFAAEEGLSGLDFEVGDAQALSLGDRRFDAVVAHTLISHTADPASVLAEARKALKPGGRLVVFDGDYASLTFAFHDLEAGRRLDWALARATFNNPVVMRGIAGLLADAGLAAEHIRADAVSEIGDGSYFRSMAETYAPLVAEAGFAPAPEVEAWLAAQREAMAAGRFFASCTYYTVVARRANGEGEGR